MLHGLVFTHVCTQIKGKQLKQRDLPHVNLQLWNKSKLKRGRSPGFLLFLVCSVPLVSLQAINLCSLYCLELSVSLWVLVTSSHQRAEQRHGRRTVSVSLALVDLFSLCFVSVFSTIFLFLDLAADEGVEKAENDYLSHCC